MNNTEIASKSHDIQIALQSKQIAEFEDLPKLGMMVNLAIHLRGLPQVNYDTLRLISGKYFNILPVSFKEILTNLEELEYVKIVGTGSSKSVLPQIPFFDDVYLDIGDFASKEFNFNEQEKLALHILSTLSQTPTEKSNIYSVGAEKKIIDRSLDLGMQGGYILSKRARGKDILLSPLFFAENSDVFLDMTAKAGASQIKKVLDLIGKSQGWPLGLIEKTMSVNGEAITKDQLSIIKSLAQDGAIKPPSITTVHAGKNNFMFTPAPGPSKLNPTNREIYERAMALVSSVRQGQLLPKKYAIRMPTAILRALKRDGYLRSTSESYAQYHQLAVMRVGTLKHISSDRYQFHLINSEENNRALDVAIRLLETGDLINMEIDQEARIALQKDQTYIESIIASDDLRKTETIVLGEEVQAEFDNLLLKASN